jgi:hypothetical protein
MSGNSSQEQGEDSGVILSGKAPADDHPKEAVLEDGQETPWRPGWWDPLRDD